MIDRFATALGDQARDPLDECVHASRLLGSDPSLVLHGGGNTSVKAPWNDITGEVVEALYVKGSGWDLATIERAGFAPLPLARMRALLSLEQLSDPDMMRELSAARLDPAAPQPSVEALLHAFIPHVSVLHSHADVILTLTNLADGAQRIATVYENRVVIVPYVMPGFDLAREVARRWDAESNDDTIGMVLLNHGLFTFGASAAEAYARHAELINAAEAHLATMPDARHAPTAPAGTTPLADTPHACSCQIADLRRTLSIVAGRPMIVTRDATPATMAFTGRHDLAEVATRGPITPDHVIRTKPVPLVGRDVEGYAARYAAYFQQHRLRSRTEVTMLDAAPRVVLDSELGMLTAGIQAKDATIAADIYRHTMAVISTCEDRLGGWVPLNESHLFDMEYWDLEQAKLRLGGAPAQFAGQVAVVTGAASGIGRACAATLLARGAAVLGLDVSDEVARTFSGPAWLGLPVDVTDLDAHRSALEAGIDRFGGFDIAVIAAGIFGASVPIAALDGAQWRRVMAVNVDAVAAAFTQLHPFLARSPVGGRVVLIGSKNVRAPGLGAAAYSASKAAVTQLARVAAFEWARDNIRVNTVHPDAVFDTGLWIAELLAERASRAGLSVDAYRHRNLLEMEVTSDLVGRVVADLCGESFAATTGAQVPIDGGNERTL